ncbi:MAG: hypothetical protein H6708_05200 [Kofleriaceae bacterium]|nr:hypothetical protein [Kofleriaceae bacterium]
MMTCRDATALASHQLGGTPSVRQRLALRVHLLMCGACRRAARQLRATVALLHAIGHDEPGPSAAREAALLDAFRRRDG